MFLQSQPAEVSAAASMMGKEETLVYNPEMYTHTENEFFTIIAEEKKKRQTPDQNFEDVLKRVSDYFSRTFLLGYCSLTAEILS